jgi:acetyl-CoA acetyltransferase
VTFPQRQAAIVGVYTTEQAKSLDRSPFSLQLEALKGALDDAGLTPRDVDGVMPMMFSSHVPGMSAFQFWAEQLGGRPIRYWDADGASGALARAATAIAAGMCEVVVLFYGKARKLVGPGGQAVPDRAPRVQDWNYTTAGGFMTSWYALWAQRYMYDFGVTSEDLAEVAVFTRHHATLNPNSVMGSRGDITVEDVINSRFVAEPLHLLDCSPDTDGGYAVVIASAEVARNCRKKPVWVLGGAQAAHTDFYISIDDPWFPQEGRAVRSCTDTAFNLAGISRDEIDVAALYDCFTITLLRDLEEMGFCKLGEGAAYVKEGHCRLDGSMPTNTDGGLLNTHSGDPSGMMPIEIVRQLRGECGARQVPNARLGVSLQQGFAVHGTASTLIMAAD